MNIVIVNYCSRLRDSIINGIIPIYTAQFSDAYWVPDNQLDSFVNFARANGKAVTNVVVYQFKSSHKPY